MGLTRKTRQSHYGIAPGGSSIAYAASNAALIHLTHCLAVALAPDVTVNCIAPGLVEGTRMAERLPEAMKQQARAPSVLGRTGSADDIAQMVVGYCRMGQRNRADGRHRWREPNGDALNVRLYAHRHQTCFGVGSWHGTNMPRRPHVV
ncbi:MAG TPA: SDR family oxidoreductase [Bradyrhizobium sp.]|nr:SDR family oxidoreductase [Bradyrhizobium sp.]